MQQAHHGELLDANKPVACVPQLVALKTCQSAPDIGLGCGKVAAELQQVPQVPKRANCGRIIRSQDPFADLEKLARDRLGHVLAAVRLDSGDLAGDARYVRETLDKAGLEEVRIAASGDAGAAFAAAVVCSSSLSVRAASLRRIRRLENCK